MPPPLRSRGAAPQHRAERILGAVLRCRRSGRGRRRLAQSRARAEPRGPHRRRRLRPRCERGDGRGAWPCRGDPPGSEPGSGGTGGRALPVSMESPAQPLPAPPLDPGPRWDEPGPEAGPELEAELEAELALWAAEPAAGTPPWAPPGRGGCPEDEPRLRPVFDALDRDGDGFVRVEEFVQFATAYGAEQVRTEPIPTRRGRSEGPALPALAPPAAARRPAPARGCAALGAAVAAVRQWG